MERKRRKGVIYRVTSPSNKVYIGQTTKALHKRRTQHTNIAHRVNSSLYHTKFSRAIRKYGDKLKWEILETNIDEDNLNELETSYIEKYNAFKAGYNSTPCGEGLISYNKLAEVKAKKAKKFRGKNNPMYGRRHTEATRKKMSEAHLKNPVAYWKGKKMPESVRKKMSEKHAGKTLTEEHKVNISKAKKGTKRSAKFKKLMSEYAKQRVGTKNAAAKLTEEDVRNIRKLSKIKTPQQLAQQYGVHKTTICRIIRGDGWKHIK